MAAEASIAGSRPSVGVEQRRGGVGILVNKNNTDSPSRADTARARIRETTTVQNLQSRVRDLRRKVVSSNEAERYWRAKVDSHKDSEKSLRSQVSELERQIVEGEIKRKKIQQEAARLKRQILLKHNADRGGAPGNIANNSGSSSDVEDSGNSDDAEAEPHRRRRSHHQRQRPSGLSYKLRDTASRATVQRYIGRKAEQLENWLTQAVGNDDSWQRVFGGDGEEEAGDRSVDREHRRGEELREAGDLAGHPSDVRVAHTPRFILGALLANYPELLSAILQSKQFKHVFKAAEERALHAIRDLWERNGLQVYTDLRLSQDAYQRLINLTTHKWDEDMEEMVRLVLP